MTQREAHLVKEQEAKRKNEYKENFDSFFLQWKAAIDRIRKKEAKEGSEED